MRTSTCTRVVPPTRWKFWSTSTRRIFACVSLGMSAISSRKSVPPWASSSAPILRVALAALAAEQLDLHVFGRDRRGIDDDEGAVGAGRRVMDAARGQFLAGARRASDQHARIDRRDAGRSAAEADGSAGDEPTMRSKAPARWRSAVTSRRSCEASSARSATSTSRSALNGFSMKS